MAPGEIVDLIQYCYACTASVGTVSGIYYNYYDPPPAGFTAVGSSSTSLGYPVSCTVPGAFAQGCKLSTCWQPYPTCWMQIEWTASTSTLPANTDNIFDLYIPGTGTSETVSFITIRPTVADLDLAAAPYTVSAPMTPAPIMVGQQVQLQAAPVTSLTNVQWTFDSTSTNDVVGVAYTQDIPIVPSPSPVPSSGSPISFFWVSGGLKHVILTANAPNVNGPLVADVYYPVTAPSPVTATATTSTVWYDPRIPVPDSGGAVTCPPTNYVIGLSLGDACGTPGIKWTYSATVPSYGSGTLTMAQLGTSTVSGIAQNGAKVTSGSGGTDLLDRKFPYYFSVPTGLSLIANQDSPGQVLTNTTCSEVTRSDSYTDYFMYQAAATSSRPSIWVTTAKMTWTWAGTTTKGSNGWGAASQITNPTPVTVLSTQLPTWPGKLQGSFTSAC
jgi:hypothetical protein